MPSEVTIVLPDTLAEKARAEGLLQPDEVERLFARELHRRELQRFEALQQLPGDPPSESEIQSEVALVRAARRSG
jgi:hypothetical protein